MAPAWLAGQLRLSSLSRVGFGCSSLLDSSSASDDSSLWFTFLNLGFICQFVLDGGERSGQVPVGPLCLCPLDPSPWPH